jgi:hypothetical protein
MNPLLMTSISKAVLAFIVYGLFHIFITIDNKK